MISPKIRDDPSQPSSSPEPEPSTPTTPSSDREEHGGMWSQFLRLPLFETLRNIFISDGYVYVVRVESPVEMRILVGSGVRDIPQGESMLQFRDEKSAIRSAWRVQDAALSEKQKDVVVKIARANSKTGVSSEVSIPVRKREDMDPSWFMPDAAKPDDIDKEDPLYGVWWENLSEVMFVFDNLPAPGTDTKIEEEWQEVIEKHTYLTVEDIDQNCKLCAGSGISRCSRCGGAAGMCLPGSTFKCICKAGCVPCPWCAGDGLVRNTLSDQI